MVIISGLVIAVVILLKKYKSTKDRLTLEQFIKDPTAQPNLSSIEMESAKQNKYGSLEDEIEKGKEKPTTNDSSVNSIDKK